MEVQVMCTPLQVERGEAAKELASAIRIEKKSFNQIRLRAVLAVAGGRRVPEVTQALAVSERSLRNWVHRYNQGGVSALTDQRQGRSCRLSAKQLSDLADRIRAGPRDDDVVCSLRGVDIQRILLKEYQTAYTLDGVYYLLHHQLKMSYLKPRPLHRKTDPLSQEAFKKISPKNCRNSPRNTRIGKSRFGSRTKAGSGNKVR